MGAENSTLQNAGSCNNANTCREACEGFRSGPTDTVKVDLGKLAGAGAVPGPAPHGGKENSTPGPDPGVTVPAQKPSRLADLEHRRKEAEAASAEQPLKEQRRLEEAERSRQRALEERRRLEEEQEKRRREEEAMAAQRQREQEERRLRQLEEKRRKKQEAEALRTRQLEKIEEARRLEEEARDAQEAWILEEQRLAQQQKEEQERLAEEALRNQFLEYFLKKTGFSSPNWMKLKKGMIKSSFSYPLHAAVEENDAQAVAVLLWAGADKDLRNSKKQTPLELAEAKNTKTSGSHAEVIAALKSQT